MVAVVAVCYLFVVAVICLMLLLLLLLLLFSNCCCCCCCFLIVVVVVVVVGGGGGGGGGGVAAAAAAVVVAVDFCCLEFAQSVVLAPLDLCRVIPTSLRQIYALRIPSEWNVGVPRHPRRTVLRARRGGNPVFRAYLDLGCEFRIKVNLRSNI